MKQELTKPQKLWIKALRSGEYSQGPERLCNENSKMCCLGVACALYNKNHSNGSVEFSSLGIDDPEWLSGELECVKDWVGLRGKEGSYGMAENGTAYSLTRLNDSGETFAEIADVIESQPYHLFVNLG